MQPSLEHCRDTSSELRCGLQSTTTASDPLHRPAAQRSLSQGSSSAARLGAQGARSAHKLQTGPLPAPYPATTRRQRAAGKRDPGSEAPGRGKERNEWRDRWNPVFLLSGMRGDGNTDQHAPRQLVTAAALGGKEPVCPARARRAAVRWRPHTSPGACCSSAPCTGTWSCLCQRAHGSCSG